MQMKLTARVFAPFCLAALAGCTEAPKDSAVSEQMLEALHSRPVGSYALVPISFMGEQLSSDGKVSGHHALVLKIAELRNNNGLTSDGKFVHRICSTFNLINTNLNDKGEVTASYSYTSGFSIYTATRAIDLSRDTTTVPTEVEEDKRSLYLEYARTQDYCTNVPASP